MSTPDVSSSAATAPRESGGCGSGGKTPCANCCRRAAEQSRTEAPHDAPAAEPPR